MPELISPLELIEDAAGETVVLDVDLDAVRQLVLRAHPDIVPELVFGDSVGTLLASVESARMAYARLAETWSETSVPPLAVPAGGGDVMAVDLERLPAAEKIRRGIKAAARRGAKE